MEDPTSVGGVNTGRWTTKEHLLFLEALKTHGQDWRRIAQDLKSRNNVQVRTHAQKYFKKLERMRRKNALKGKKPSAMKPKSRYEDKLSSRHYDDDVYGEDVDDEDISGTESDTDVSERSNNGKPSSSNSLMSHFNQQQELPRTQSDLMQMQFPKSMPPNFMMAGPMNLAMLNGVPRYVPTMNQVGGLSQAQLLRPLNFGPMVTQGTSAFMVRPMATGGAVGWPMSMPTAMSSMSSQQAYSLQQGSQLLASKLPSMPINPKLVQPMTPARHQPM